MKDLGEAQDVLNMHIERDRKRKEISIQQSSYIHGILARFQMGDSYAVATPMDQGAPKALDIAYIQAKAESCPGTDP